ncbi:hypothetical protein BKA82DRAFT_4365203 [Pisolithus tinctorius]|nr:hypothetical protein BKA82DRAFT_4365203 [Pisolithus tinctorius]
MLLINLFSTGAVGIAFTPPSLALVSEDHQDAWGANMSKRRIIGAAGIAFTPPSLALVSNDLQDAWKAKVKVHKAGMFESEGD